MKKWVTVYKAIDDLPSLTPGETDEDDPLHDCRNHRGDTPERYATADYGDTPHGGKSPRKLFPHEPAWTVTVAQGKTDIHYDESRMITPRETARLQTFPDWFEVPTHLRNDKCRVIGNAVPPLMAQRLVEVLP